MTRDEFNARASAMLRRAREDSSRRLHGELARVAGTTIGACGLLVLMAQTEASTGIEAAVCYGLAGLILCGGIALCAALVRLQRD